MFLLLKFGPVCANLGPFLSPIVLYVFSFLNFGCLVSVLVQKDQIEEVKMYRTKVGHGLSYMMIFYINSYLLYCELDFCHYIY